MSLALCSVGLLLVLMARKPAQRLLGASPAFSLWLLPILLAITPWLPDLPTPWPAPRAIATLPGIRVLLMPEMIVVEAARPTFGVLWLWLGGSALLLIRLIAHHYRIRRNSTAPSPPLLRALRPWSRSWLDTDPR